MSAKHTPGPWTFERDTDGTIHGCNVVRGGEYGALVATCNRHPKGDGFLCGAGADDPDANARLIAAAPELLEALRTLMAQVKPYADGDGAAMYHAQNIARAAIRKAEGGAA